MFKFSKTMVCFFSVFGMFCLFSFVQSSLSHASENYEKLPEAKYFGKNRTELVLPQDVLRKYEGKFYLTEKIYFTLKIIKKQLMAKLTGQSFAPIYPMGSHKFFYKIVDAELNFLENENGNIYQLVLFQNGMKQVATKRGFEEDTFSKGKKIVLTNEDLKQYLGIYRRGNLEMTISSKGNQLFIQIKGQPKVLVYPEGDHKFSLKLVGANLEFNFDDFGEVSSVSLFQNGVNYILEKRGR